MNKHLEAKVSYLKKEDITRLVNVQQNSCNSNKLVHVFQEIMHLLFKKITAKGKPSLSEQFVFDTFASCADKVKLKDFS